MFALSAVSLAIQPKTSAAQQNSTTTALTYKSVREALHAIKSSKDETERGRIYQSFNRIPIVDRDDLLSLHAEARDREINIPFLAANDALMRYGGDAEMVARHIADANGPQFEDTIVKLLQDELETALKDGRPVKSAPTTRGAIKVALKEARIKSLMFAAAKGRFTKSRDVLWRYIDVDHDSGFGQEAVTTLGRIGDMNDFERLLLMVEKNPSLRFPIGDFGPIVLPRLIQEFSREDIGRDVKGNLSGALSRAVTHEAIPELIKLRKNKDAYVAETALDIISKNLSTNDLPLAMQLLDSPSSAERASVLVAIGENAWNVALVPALLKTLKTDRDYSNRVLAASILGQHNVKSALPELNSALQDPVPIVRKSAESAINRINNIR